MAYEIELTDMEAAPCQWILSFGDLRHIGYVQKTTGFIHIIEPSLSESTLEEIKQQVETQLQKRDLPLSQAPHNLDLES